jgi:hypothetical protein
LENKLHFLKVQGEVRALAEKKKDLCAENERDRGALEALEKQEQMLRGQLDVVNIEKRELALLKAKNNAERMMYDNAPPNWNDAVKSWRTVSS